MTLTTSAVGLDVLAPTECREARRQAFQKELFSRSILALALSPS